MPKPYPDSVSAMLLHAERFLLRVPTSFFQSLGTTPLGFVIPFLISVLGIVVTIIIISRRRGREGVRQHLRENLTTAAKVVIIVTIVVYGSVFLITLIRELYLDHAHLVV